MARSGPFLRSAGAGRSEGNVVGTAWLHYAMQITVLLFASYADALGARSLTLDLPAGARTSAVLRTLREHPGATALPPAPLVAVNERYSGPDTPLAEGDVVAVLPPVAGG